MSNETRRALRDPFGDDIVTEPRQIENPVAAVNGAALEQLLAAFGAVASGPRPRLNRDRGATLVLSPAPGYGKSHLIGRLFQRLHGDATLLYLRPFQDPSSCWISLLEKVVSELDHPDAAGKLVCDPGELTQLDTLARRILLTVVGDLLRKKQIAHPDRDAALDLLQRFPNGALETPEWRSWLESDRDTIIDALDKALKGHAIALAPSRRAWLKVLLAYAYSEDKPDIRQLCLDWIMHRPVDLDDAKGLGLKLAELPDADEPYEQRNERSFVRLRDIFAIGAFYRPFTLCFDQTELYGSSPGLARTFGVVLSRLRRETCNHFVVVTGNIPVWEPRVGKNFEEADQHAITPAWIELQGMSEGHARDLVVQRFAAWDIREDASAFCAGFLPTLFKMHPLLSPRDVLRAARKAWGTAAEPAVSAIFASYRRRHLASPKGLVFDPGVLEWAVVRVLGPAVSAVAERMRSPKGFLTVRWQTNERQELFGFETGNQWKRWEAILREAHVYHEDGKSKTERARACFFRAQGQKPLAARILSRLDSGGAVHVVELNLEELATLFAAHDFAADVAQQDHRLNEAEVLSFLQKELTPIAMRAWGGWPAPPTTVPPPRPLAQLVEEQVRSKRFVTLALLVKALLHAAATETEVLLAAGSIAKIKVHTSPSNTVLQWLP